jgi:hypothetical protein
MEKRDAFSKWTWIVAWGVAALLSLILGLTDNAVGSDTFKLGELEEVSAQYKHFYPGARDPLFYNSNPKEELNLTVNTTLLHYLFWNNRIHSMTNASQYYVVGWNLQLGVRLTPFLELGYDHFSKHLLDDKLPNQRFPVTDAYFLNLYLYRAKHRGEAILD